MIIAAALASNIVCEDMLQYLLSFLSTQHLREDDRGRRREIDMTAESFILLLRTKTEEKSERVYEFELK